MRTAQKGRKNEASRKIGAEIIEGLQEAIAFERGEKTEARFVAAPIGARQASAAAPPEFSPADVANVRKALRFSQAVFAQALNVSPETVRSWEQGKSPPSGSSKRLLEIAQKFPHVFEQGMIRRESAAHAAAGERRARVDRRAAGARR
ncbi:MAG TPA: helix-turn-helix domain-containing protein [Gemmatimonadaceae bacterium]|jgi:putative transcriptional regulator